MAVQPKSPFGADAAPFFAEGTPRPKSAEPSIQWSPPRTQQTNVAGQRVTIHRGVVTALPAASASLRCVESPNRTWWRWVAYTAEVRLEGVAHTELEALEMVTRAVGALPKWQKQVMDLRSQYASGEPRQLTEEEERVFKAIELLVGARPRYTPLPDGRRAWAMDDRNIPNERVDDWRRHGHTICGMLRDLLR